MIARSSQYSFDLMDPPAGRSAPWPQLQLLGLPLPSKFERSARNYTACGFGACGLEIAMRTEASMARSSCTKKALEQQYLAAVARCGPPRPPPVQHFVHLCFGLALYFDRVLTLSKTELTHGLNLEIRPVLESLSLSMEPRPPRPSDPRLRPFLPCLRRSTRR